MSRFPARWRLYLVWIDGCPVCATTKPIVRAWAEKHSRTVKLVELNLLDNDWKADRWSPNVVPTLVLLAPDRGVYYREGAVTSEADIDEWLRRRAPAALEG